MARFFGLGSSAASGGGSGANFASVAAFTSLEGIEQSGFLFKGRTSIAFAAGSGLKAKHVGYYAFTRVYRSVTLRGNFVSRITAVDEDTQTITVEDGFNLEANTGAGNVPGGTGWHIVPFALPGSSQPVPAGLTHLSVQGYAGRYAGMGASSSNIGDEGIRADRWYGGFDNGVSFVSTLMGAGRWANIVEGEEGAAIPEPLLIGYLHYNDSTRTLPRYELQYDSVAGTITLIEPDYSRPGSASQWPIVSTLFLAGS